MQKQYINHLIWLLTILLSVISLHGNAQQTNMIPPPPLPSSLPSVSINCSGMPHSDSEKRFISGMVTDKKGEALIGANILVENSYWGTVTDIDGMFSLNIPEELWDLELVISYVGYEASIISPSALSENMLIELTSGVTLQEVVVTGMVGRIKECPALSGCINKKQKILNRHLNKTPQFSHYTNAQTYPNPFLEQLNISFDFPKSATYMVHLYMLDGRLIYEENYALGAGKQDVELKNIPQNIASGFYVLKLFTKEEILLVESVVKARD